MDRSPVVMLVTRDYIAQYTDPIAAVHGAEVRVEREDDGFPGWWWCVSADGRAGWVPADLLEPAGAPGAIARLRSDYDARELTVNQGMAVTVLEVRDAWCLVRTCEGATGWVPQSHLARAPSREPTGS